MARSRSIIRFAWLVGVPGLALLAVLLVVGCGVRLPDLERLYRDPDSSTAQPPVVIIPGMLGSRLRDRESGEERWPGSLWQTFWGDRQHLGLRIDPDTLEPIDDGIEAYDLFDTLWINDYYGDLLKTLEQAGRYVRTEAGTPVSGPGRRYYVLPYDWRHDNVRAARQLDALITQIRADHGDPDLKVDVVAHSMGGLILRYYLRYGTVDVLDDNDLPINYHGVSRVRSAILLGTPNLGAVSAVHGFIEGYRVGLRRVPPEVTASMPSAYQLFPHPLQDWLITADGRPLKRDLFDVNIWRAFQWSIFDHRVQRTLASRQADAKTAEADLKLRKRYFEHRLERARRFVWSLTRQLDDTPERLVVMGGNCTLTPARLLVEEINDESVVRLWPQQVKTGPDPARIEAAMLEPGDGVVTKASLLGRSQLDPSRPRHEYAVFPLASSLFLCESHGRLTGNPSFQDNLLDTLLSHERLFDQRTLP